MKRLKEEAKKQLEKGFEEVDVSLSKFEKYALWDKMDDLEAIYEENTPDFNFVYYIALNNLLEKYMRLNKMTYSPKVIFKQLTNNEIREKYLLKEIKDEKIKEAITKCIMSHDKKEKLDNFKLITNKVFELCGGFEIDGFKMKS